VTILYIDADACPVRAEVEAVASRLKVRVLMVSNGGIRPSANPLVEMIYVEQGLDVADRWIAERAGPGDVVVTADIPLADLCVKNGARVLTPAGETLTPGNIGGRLATRDLLSDLRGADPFMRGGGKGFTKADRSRFLQGLDTALRAALKGGS
jgi:uncharacterized protein YaiI (UPF0178 family)